jgi:eukaryotic-like serine/threonine-protein kinase
MSSLGIAPPEKTGDGVLFPALVVGVGQTGLGVIRKLRQIIRDRFVTTEAIPTVRFLYLDTDPEAVAAATQGPDAQSAREVVLARLNRAGYYLQEAAIPSVDAWLPPGILYRLARSPGAAGGVRAFGRLALCDNYRVIAQRIRQEIETFLTDDPLDRTGAQTLLGVRSNRPRAYVVAGLGGGTGSGMFLDLAYILKHEFRGVGYRKPEAVGVLLAPPADPKAPKSAALSNTFAALTELHHFAAGARYQTKFDNNEAPITDTEGPFARTAVVQLPRTTKPHEQDRVYGLAARGLFVELLTPAGRVTDYVRSVAPMGRNPAAPTAQIFGLYRLAWPRAELLGVAARRFKQRLMQRWSGKEATHLREPIRHWLQEQWAKQKLEPQQVFDRFEQAVREALRESPAAVFDAAVDTLRTRTPGGGRANAAAACNVFEQIIRLVGKPTEENEAPGSLEPTVDASRTQLLTEVESSLAAMSVSFIEQPQYRLAGAEEALTQLSERLKNTIEDLEHNRTELAREVRESYGRVFQAIGALGSTTGLGAIAGRRGSLINELLDALPEYARKRFRLIQYNASAALYRTLFGNIPEYLREVGFCRGRLGELSQTLATQGGTKGESGPNMLILPDGCLTLDDAADQFLGVLAPEDILTFDQTLQRELARRFRGLVNVCLKPEKSADFLTLLTSHAREFLDARLERTDPATVFLRYRGGDAAGKQLLADAYAKAAPEVSGVAGPPPMEAAIFAVPTGSSGAEVRAIMADTCPGIEFIPAPLPDDILIYRECPRVELTALPQLASHAREAYEAQLTADAPPHTRADITWQ